MSAQATLDDILDEARTADRTERINLRNAIAEHGAAAIPAMRGWISDAELGAFAVRVLERIAERPTDRSAAIAALTGLDLTALTPSVARDVKDALERLGQHRAAGGDRSREAEPKRWPGYATAPPLEKRFHDDMLDIFRSAGEATRKERPDGTFIRGYWAIYFLRGVRNHGGLMYARRLLRAQGTTEGFARLTEERRLDLTMEALVLPEYADLFTPEERQIAASRLAKAGYEPGKS